MSEWLVLCGEGLSRCSLEPQLGRVDVAWISVGSKNK